MSNATDVKAVRIALEALRNIPEWIELDKRHHQSKREQARRDRAEAPMNLQERWAEAERRIDAAPPASLYPSWAIVLVEQFESDPRSVPTDDLNRLISFAMDELRLREARAVQAPAVTGGKVKRRRRPRRTNSEARPLTPTQTKIMELVGANNGDTQKVADDLGISRQAVEKAYKAGMKKLGLKALPKPKKKSIPMDDRGQDTLSEPDARMKIKTKK